MSLWRITRLKFLYPIVLFLVIFSDGSIYSAFSNYLILDAFHFIPMLFLSWIAFVTMFNDDDNIHYYPWLMIGGLIFGSYYSNPAGIYIYIIGFLIFGLIIKIFSRPNSGISYNLFIFLISLLTYLYIIYGLASLSGMATTSFLDQSFYFVLPIMIINAILFAILYSPIQRLIIWADESRADSPYRGRNR